LEIVINEWLLEYLRPNADKSNREMALRFVNAWVKRCDKVVIKRESPFVSKFHTFMKKFEWDFDFTQRSKKLYQLLFLNSDKTIIVDDSDIKKLPADIIEKTPPKDKYLIEIGYSYPQRVIVTTDRRLRDIFKEETNLKICLFEDFRKEYFL